MGSKFEVIEDQLYFNIPRFNLSDDQEAASFNELIRSKKPNLVNRIDHQLVELYKWRWLDRGADSEEIKAEVEHQLSGKRETFGTWFYYPWNNTVVHVLNEDDFIDLRTSRNQLKITKEEQASFVNRTVGIIGLSVGNAVATNLVMERLCGEVRLADFDGIDLSNLNRLRAGLPDLGANKATVAARQIKELDPYMRVQVYQEGYTAENAPSFFEAGGTLDLLVEVCDSMQVKVDSRLYAKALNVPVIMDTNDRGMLDVERFDAEPDRPIFHGLLDGTDTSNLSSLEPDERMELISKLISLDRVSPRLKKSMPQIGKTLMSWPQLASGVFLGAALSANVCRRIFLGEDVPSGRYYIDMDELVSSDKFVGL